MATKTKPATTTKSKTAAKPTKKGTTAAKASADLTRPIELAKEVKKSDGPCEAIRSVAAKFRSLKRGDVLEVAKAARINKFTASRQFHLQRSGA